MYLNDDSFSAERFAHRLLREAAKPTDTQVLRGVRAPNKAAAHLALTFEADAAGMCLRHPRVQLVRRWIDMSSGVRV